MAETKRNVWPARLALLLSGLLFGVGLGVAGMTLPTKVLGFLDVTGRWDASLAFVMIGAIGVHTVLLRIIRRRPSPLFDARFHLPTRRDLDGRLIAGAALFGVGWGLGGFCPGPAVVSVVTGQPGVLVFVGAMLAGMALQHATSEGPAGQAEGADAGPASDERRG